MARDAVPATFGPFTLRRQLGAGGMAEVYLATATGAEGFEKFLCVKMIRRRYAEDPDFIQLLVEEAKILVHLQHPNIGQVFDLGVIDGRYFLAMEFVDGIDAFKLLLAASDKDIHLPIEAAAYIGRELCAGLAFAHEQTDSLGRPLGIIHRDVSPQNVLIAYEGEVKLVDFGVAKARLRAQQTEAGVVKGKYNYLSPEQAAGETLDPRSDIFSAGIVLHELITGRQLYEGDNVALLLDMARAAKVPHPAKLRTDVPKALAQVALKALARKPKDRFATAGEMRDALDAFLRQHAPGYGAAKLSELVAWLVPPPEPVADLAVKIQSSPGERRGRSSLTRMTRGELRMKEAVSIVSSPGVARSDLDGPTVTSTALPLAAGSGPVPLRVGGASDAVVLPPSGHSPSGRRLTPTELYVEAPTDDAQPTRTDVAIIEVAPAGTPPHPSFARVGGSSSNVELPTQSTQPYVEMDAPTSAADPRAVPSLPQAGAGFVPAQTPSASARGPASIDSRPSWMPRTAQPSIEATPIKGGSLPPPIAMRRSGGPPADALTPNVELPPSSARMQQTIELTQVQAAADRARRRLVILALVLGAVLLGLVGVLGYRLYGPRSASIRIRSTPAGAAVYVDSVRESAVTPSVLELSLERDHVYTIELRREGHYSWTSRFSGDAPPAAIDATLAPSTGSLAITSEPPDADVYVNAVPRGRTPIDVSDLDLAQDAEVLVDRPGYRPARLTHRWGGQTRGTIHVVLERMQ
ncbi:MAG: protein kinase [Deltaproteobacteria bacterium]|nr:protein kinase [Deltaproteobacteria bacterium]